MKQRRKSKEVFTLKCLLDTGATGTIIQSKYVKHLKRHKCAPTKWSTQNGTFITNSKAKIEFLLPELNDQRLVNTYVHDTNNPMSYDMIMGQDLMQELGIDVINSTKTVRWDDQEISQRPHNTTIEEMMNMIKDPPAVEAETKRISDILDAKYQPADLKEVVKDIPDISKEDRQEIFKLLKKYEILFNGQLGKWVGPPHTIHLKDNVTPYHGKPYKIPQVYEATLKAEVERLVKLGVLKKVNHSE